MKKLVILAVLLAMVSGSAQADTLGWGAFFDGDFANAGNWFEGGPSTMPGMDDLYIDSDYTPFGAGIIPAAMPTLSSLSTNAYMLIVNPFYDASMTITAGGELRVGLLARLGQGNLMNGSTGTLNMDGGYMVSGILEIGHNLNDGTNTVQSANGVVNMSGNAILHTANLSFGQGIAGYGFDAAATGIGQVNMTDETLFVVNGDHTAESWVGDGWITAVGAGESISVFYNSIDARTEYTVIPEPTTLGLLGLVGAGMLCIRRRF